MSGGPATDAGGGRGRYRDGRVTVCIPTFNQAPYLADAVRSALAQTVPPAAVIVCDDASTDRTPIVMAELAAAEPSVRYVRHPTNVGIAENNARLMELADTEFVVRVDSDDQLEPSFIATLLPMMLGNPRAGYGHGAIQRMDGDGRPTYQVFLDRRRGYQEPDDALRAGIKGYRVAANVVIYRTAAIRQVNLFYGRPDFGEDYDMSVRLADAGWGNVYTDQIVARYRVWTDAAGTRPRRKARELTGYRRIFDEVFTPAFAARGWDPRPLARQRRQLALAHAPSCHLPPYDRDDRDRLVGLLRQLGPGRRLELKLVLLRAGAAPLFERAYHANGHVKNLVKRLLAAARRPRAAAGRPPTASTPT